jgi:hypothetical protein
VSHGLLEQLAAHALALRFGDGATGLARGLGLTVLVVCDLPAGVEVAADEDGVVALRDERETLVEIARHLLDPYMHDDADVRTLARRLREKSTDEC